MNPSKTNTDPSWLDTPTTTSTPFVGEVQAGAYATAPTSADVFSGMNLIIASLLLVGVCGFAIIRFARAEAALHHRNR